MSPECTATVNQSVNPERERGTVSVHDNMPCPGIIRLRSEWAHRATGVAASGLSLGSESRRPGGVPPRTADEFLTGSACLRVAYSVKP